MHPDQSSRMWPALLYPVVGDVPSPEAKHWFCCGGAGRRVAVVGVRRCLKVRGELGVVGCSL